MKRLFLFLFILTVVVCSSIGQNSMMFSMPFDDNYYIEETLIRRYNKDFNIVMAYGRGRNTIYSSDTILEHSSFFLYMSQSGDISHIVSLPGGWKVNDICFVTLKKIGGGYEDFCCFCGTKTRITGGYYTPSLEPGGGSYVITDTISGFAGFFSMSDVMSPSTAHTAKIRDIEFTHQLFRMCGYAENQGAYWTDQNSFEDNAVLDIIGVGVDTNRNTFSCMTRVKFYPDVYGATRWDNNIRYNMTETMSDIIATDNHVVTVSYYENNPRYVVLRYSNKETVLTTNGLELSPIIHNIPLYNLDIHGFHFYDESRTLLSGPIRLCNMGGETFSLAFGINNIVDLYCGLLNFKHSADQRYVYIHGVAMRKDTRLLDLAFLSVNNSTMMLNNKSFPPSYDTEVIPWSNYVGDSIAIKRLSSASAKLQSLYNVYDIYDDFIAWTGINNSNSLYPLRIARQKEPYNFTYGNACLSPQKLSLPVCNIRLSDSYLEFPIQRRFPDNQEIYPVRFIHFQPQKMDKEMICLIIKADSAE